MAADGIFVEVSLHEVPTKHTKSSYKLPWEKMPLEWKRSLLREDWTKNTPVRIWCNNFSWCSECFEQELEGDLLLYFDIDAQSFPQTSCEWHCPRLSDELQRPPSISIKMMQLSFHSFLRIAYWPFQTATGHVSTWSRWLKLCLPKNLKKDHQLKLVATQLVQVSAINSTMVHLPCELFRFLHGPPYGKVRSVSKCLRIRRAKDVWHAACVKFLQNWGRPTSN